MSLIIPDGFGQVIHSLTLSGDPEPMAVTFGVESAGADAANASTIAQGLHNAFFDAFDALLPTVYSLLQTEVRFNVGGSADLVVGIHVEPKTFLNSTPPVPQNSAYILQKRTNLSGRRNRGRLYLPGVGEVLVDAAGKMSATAITGVNGDAAGWLNAIKTTVTGITNMVVLHSTGISGAPPPTIVQQLLLDPILGTQRRRLRK